VYLNCDISHYIKQVVEGYHATVFAYG